MKTKFEVYQEKQAAIKLAKERRALGESVKVIRIDQYLTVPGRGGQTVTRFEVVPA